MVGQKIFLPNIIFKMVRNHTPAGKPYNPYEATFRIPQSLTKNDIRSYLDAVYGVKTTYIRTDNYFAPVPRSGRQLSQPVRQPPRTFKRAVVGLVEPFYYPMAAEDMGEKERSERMQLIESTYNIAAARRDRLLRFLKMTKSATSGPDSGVVTSRWKWRGEVTANRGKILRLVAMRRAEREAEAEIAKLEMLAQRRA